MNKRLLLVAALALVVGFGGSLLSSPININEFVSYFSDNPRGHFLRGSINGTDGVLVIGGAKVLKSELDKPEKEVLGVGLAEEDCNKWMLRRLYFLPLTSKEDIPLEYFPSEGSWEETTLDLGDERGFWGSFSANPWPKSRLGQISGFVHKDIMNYDSFMAFYKEKPSVVPGSVDDSGPSLSPVKPKKKNEIWLGHVLGVKNAYRFVGLERAKQACKKGQKPDNVIKIPYCRIEVGGSENVDGLLFTRSRNGQSNILLLPIKPSYKIYRYNGSAWEEESIKTDAFERNYYDHSEVDFESLKSFRSIKQFGSYKLAMKGDVTTDLNSDHISWDDTTSDLSKSKLPASSTRRSAPTPKPSSQPPKPTSALNADVKTKRPDPPKEKSAPKGKPKPGPSKKIVEFSTNVSSQRDRHQALFSLLRTRFDSLPFGNLGGFLGDEARDGWLMLFDDNERARLVVITQNFQDGLQFFGDNAALSSMEIPKKGRVMIMDSESLFSDGLCNVKLPMKKILPASVVPTVPPLDPTSSGVSGITPPSSTGSGRGNSCVQPGPSGNGLHPRIPVGNTLRPPVNSTIPPVNSTDSSGSDSVSVSDAGNGSSGTTPVSPAHQPNLGCLPRLPRRGGLRTQPPAPHRNTTSAVPPRRPNTVPLPPAPPAAPQATKNQRPPALRPVLAITPASKYIYSMPWMVGGSSAAAIGLMATALGVDKMLNSRSKKKREIGYWLLGVGIPVMLGGATAAVWKGRTTVSAAE